MFAVFVLPFWARLGACAELVSVSAAVTTKKMIIYVSFSKSRKNSSVHNTHNNLIHNHHP
jgi:hypothetical protein